MANEVAHLKGHSEQATGLAFSPDGKLLASGGEGTEATVKLWDVATRKELATLPTTLGRHGALALVGPPTARQDASRGGRLRQDRPPKAWDGGVNLWQIKK